MNNNKLRAPPKALIRDMMAKTGMTFEDIVSKFKTKLIGRHPFWGILVAPIEFILSDKNKTAWTNGEKVWFNPDFFMDLTFEEFCFVGTHEVWHMANLHIPRLGARHPRLWNFATDHFINLTLAIEAEAHPYLFAVPDFTRIFNDPSSSIVMDERFTDWSADAIYAQLMREQKQDEGEDESGEGNPMDGDLDYDDYHNGDGKETQEEKARRLEKLWKGRMAAAADAGKKAGSMPGSLARWVQELLKPTVDWQTVLSAYISQTLADYDWCSPDRRFTDWDFVVPDMVGEELKAAVVIDTSGSISDDMVKHFISETYHIIRNFDKVIGIFVGHDHQVHDWIEFDSDEPPTGFTGGGGGTDFICIGEEFKERNYKPNVVIHFTDCYGEWPDKPDYPYIVVAVNTPQDGPEWAITIHIEID